MKPKQDERNFAACTQYLMAPQRGEEKGIQQKEITLMKQMRRRMGEAFINMD
jgi:hypothetical protein